MQDKLYRFLLTIGLSILLIGFSFAQTLEISDGQSKNNGEKSNPIEKLLLTSETTSVQSNAGGRSNSGSYKNISSVGQPGPVGVSTSAGYINSSGFISTLIFGEADITAPTAPTALTANGRSPSAWTNNDQFQIDWTNPPDVSGILEAYYKLSDAPIANDDTSGSLPRDGGIVIATAENGQNLYVWLVDSVGNVDYNNYEVVLMRYDTTGPTLTIASSPDTSTFENFEVTWGGGNDGAGSGLSGDFNVRVKDGAGSWVDWLTNFHGNNSIYSGSHGKTYYFEAAAIDCVGNEESFTGIAEDTTVVDTSISDTQAPAAPTNLLAGGSNPSRWQNSPGFELIWQNPPDMSGIAAAYYKLDSAPTSNYDTTGSLSAQSPDSVTASSEEGQILYLWLEDGVGNIDFNNYGSIELRYETSNPTGTIASSIDTSNNHSFLVTWNRGSDTGGSGLSGRYDVKVKDGSGAWTNWVQNHNDTSYTYTGEHGHTYYFEAAARDNAGNIETFTGTAECSTAVDTTGDTSAPLAPTDLAATPSNWTNQNDFSITWQNPEPDQYIDGVWYKIGTEPTHDDDGVYVNNNTEITNLTVPSTGQHDIYLWLQDVTGNHSYVNRASTTLYFDDVEPGITPNLAANYNIGVPIPVNASFTDNHSGFKNADLYYRRSGSSTITGPEPFVNDTVIIPQSFNTQQGIEFYIEAFDSAGNSSRLPLTGFGSIQILLAGDGGRKLDNSGQPVAQPYGSTANHYRIFSVPFILDSKTPAAVLEDDLGAYDNTKWRFFDVQNATLREYPDIRNQNLVNPGKGFLLIVGTSNKVIDAGPGRTPKTADYTQIPLNAGWNLVGNPFDFDISFNNLSVDGTQPDAHYHGSSGWTTGGTFRKWEGLAIYTQNATNLIINPQSSTMPEFQLSTRFAGNDWGIKVSAYGENSADKNNYVGVFSELDESKRNYWHEPPRLPNAISLAIKPVENELYKVSEAVHSNLSAAIHQSNEDGNYWDFEITGEKPAENIKIDLEYFAEFPEDFEKYLIDSNIKVVYNLDNYQDELALKTNSDKKCSFRILVGKKEFVEANSNGLSLVPTAFELRQNFPNPFNPSTRMVFSIPKEEQITLEVFNLLGQKVKTIINKRKMDMGYHTIEWDGSNDRGEKAASGMYIFRLRSTNKVDMKKGILIR